MKKIGCIVLCMMLKNTAQKNQRILRVDMTVYYAGLQLLQMLLSTRVMHRQR